MARKAKAPKEKRLPVRIQTIVGACRGGADALPYHPTFGSRRRAHLLAGAVRTARRYEIGRAGDRAWLTGSGRRRAVRPISDMAGGMSAIGQQASAVETAVRVVSGAAIKPSAKEREYLVDRLKAAHATLRWIEMHEAEVRAAIARGA